jgi:hypothetical protein
MQIVPLIAGDAQSAMRLCQAAIERGVFAQAIRPPTVAEGTSRLRLTAMASHTHTELEMAAGIFGSAARAVGIEPESFLTPPPERASTPAILAAAAADPGYGVDYFTEAPFDLERDGHFPEVSRPAAERRPREGAELEFETVEAGQQETAPPRPDAPFDLERELSGARAA